MTDNVLQPRRSSSCSSLNDCIAWLSALPPPERRALEEATEFRDFLRSLERLAWASRRPLPEDRSPRSTSAQEPSPPLHWASLSDDVWIRVFDFLSCRFLVRIAATCWGLNRLAKKVALRRAQPLAHHRQLNDPFRLLRAWEQVRGDRDSCVGEGAPSVSIPVLLLSRRVIVSGCGDDDFNGTYHCTGCNGNGYVFTKPRGSIKRRRAPVVAGQWPAPGCPDEAFAEDCDDRHDADDSFGSCGAHGRTQWLRCYIAKRFSNETILWYMSKEVAVRDQEQEVEQLLIEDTEEGERPGGEEGLCAVTQIFGYWAPLLVEGDASSDLCRYPSQSSRLMGGRRRGGDDAAGVGWQSLPSTHHLSPPTVELLDA